MDIRDWLACLPDLLHPHLNSSIIMFRTTLPRLTALFLAIPAVFSWPDTDQYGGKKLAGITNYTVVPGIFIQDDPKFNSTGYNLLNDSFGLIDKSPQRWSNLTRWVRRVSGSSVLVAARTDRHSYITQLNKEADEYTTYKLIYIGQPIWTFSIAKADTCT